LPFDTKPTNEKLKVFSDTVEEILSYQMQEGKFRKVFGTGVDAMATYGTGFIFGPFVKKITKTSVTATEDAGFPQIKEQQYEYDCPYHEHAARWTCTRTRRPKTYARERGLLGEPQAARVHPATEGQGPATTTRRSTAR
jgi:hypothetical protein